MIGSFHDGQDILFPYQPVTIHRLFDNSCIVGASLREKATAELDGIRNGGVPSAKFHQRLHHPPVSLNDRRVDADHWVPQCGKKLLSVTGNNEGLVVQLNLTSIVQSLNWKCRTLLYCKYSVCEESDHLAFALIVVSAKDWSDLVPTIEFTCLTFGS